jgi:hypothetical protein
MINNDTDLDNVLLKLAQAEVFDLETLEARNSDSLDFHDVHVSSIRDMLRAAFNLGVEHRSNGGF